MFDFHDLHLHTRPHSPDAHWRATLPNMLRRAVKNGVSTVGLANHYFLNTDFRLFQRLPQQIARHRPSGLTVLNGAELCVLNRQGEISLTATEAAQLDFVLAGPHHFKQRWVERPCLDSVAMFVAQQHETLLNAARQPLVNGLAHPWVIDPARWSFGDCAAPSQVIGRFLSVWTEALFAELGAVAAAHDTALEIGMGLHLMAAHQGEPFWQQYRRGVQAARNSGARFYFGSDAHHLHVVARLDWLKPTLTQLGFTPTDIIDPQSWRIK